MSLLERLKNWWFGNPPVWTNCRAQACDPLNDPVVMESVMRACKTGNIVIGNRREDGSWDIKEHKIEDTDEANP